MDEITQAVNDSDIADSILKDLVVHDMEVKGRGPYKMLSISFLKDGKEQAIQTTACPLVDFLKDNHFEDLKKKLANFIENRPGSVFERKKHA